jgi:aldose 1-epimerase
MGIRKSLWGTQEGQDIYLLTITNGHLELSVTNLGCTIVSILLPDETGNQANMVLGYDCLEGYLADTFYMGCIVGRFANRIANAAFQIGNATYNLTANETGTGNHLHGGKAGFNKKVFDIIETPYGNANAIQFFYKSVNGEEGFPGNLDVYVTYQVTDENEIIIDYKGTTDKTTPVNLTNHSYFNLSGAQVPAINHELFINSEWALVADETYIPTGELKSVVNTELDFRNWRPIHAQPDTSSFAGYNECFSFTHANASTNAVAGLRDPLSGRSMTVRTTLPGMMLYTGDFLKTPYLKNEGICLETQFFPDSPNRPEFPSTLLHPGDVYQHRTVYQFFN